MTGRESSLDQRYANAELWRAEAIALRAILLDCGLTETLKWGKPCYSHDGANICIIQRMKDFLALLFFKGALIGDNRGLLAPQGPNSRSGYRATFTSLNGIERANGDIRACVAGAIEVERKGLKLEMPDAGDLAFPNELVDAFDADPDFRSAFDALTPGRQRGWLLHICGARQAATRARRIAKGREKIILGKGPNDR